MEEKNKQELNSTDLNQVAGGTKVTVSEEKEALKRAMFARGDCPYCLNSLEAYIMNHPVDGYDSARQRWKVNCHAQVIHNYFYLYRDGRVEGP